MDLVGSCVLFCIVVIEMDVIVVKEFFFVLVEED